LIGGADRLSWLSFELQTPGSSVSIYPGNAAGLDNPRPGATARFLYNRSTALRVVFGTSDPTLPLAIGLRDDSAPLTTGPNTAALTWTGASCVQLTNSRNAVGVEALCAGGLRNGVPTRNAVLVSWLGSTDTTSGSIGSISATELPDFFPNAINDVIWLGDFHGSYATADSSSVFAQSANALFKIDRLSKALVPVTATPTRALGGRALPQANGSTFVFGGVDSAGLPNTTLQYFLPNVTWDIND
jgi:hypothetical protein